MSIVIGRCQRRQLVLLLLLLPAVTSFVFLLFFYLLISFTYLFSSLISLNNYSTNTARRHRRYTFASLNRQPLEAQLRAIDYIVVRAKDKVIDVAFPLLIRALPVLIIVLVLNSSRYLYEGDGVLNILLGRYLPLRQPQRSLIAFATRSNYIRRRYIDDYLLLTFSSRYQLRKTFFILAIVTLDIYSYTQALLLLELPYDQ